MCLQDKRSYITKRPLLEQRDDSHHLISLYKRMLGFHGLWGHSVGVTTVQTIFYPLILNLNLNLPSHK